MRKSVKRRGLCLLAAATVIINSGNSLAFAAEVGTSSVPSAAVLGTAKEDVPVQTDVETAECTDPYDWLWSKAYYDEEKGYFVLTEDVTWTSGSIWYNTPYTGDFTLEMDYYTGVSDRPEGGADGITVAFYADYLYNMGQGQEMGFYGSQGYGVELDTFYNPDYQDPDYQNIGNRLWYGPEYNHIGLVYEVGSNHLVTERLPESEDGTWHHLKIELKNYVCTVYVDGEEKFSYQVQSTGYGWIGITSATGNGTNLHAVKNISITGNPSNEKENLISVTLDSECIADPFPVYSLEEGIVVPEPASRYEYEITATVRNGMSITAKDVDITFQSGEPLNLMEGSSAKIELGDIPSGEEKTVKWKVYAAIPEDGVSAEFKVITLVDNQIRLSTADYVYLDGSYDHDNTIQFGIDQWSFSNSFTYFGPEGETYCLQDTDYQALLKESSNMEREYINEQKNQNWYGSCHGMAVTVILAKIGRLNPADIPNGRESLYAIPKVNNDNVESFINFYQLQQFLFPVIYSKLNFAALPEDQQLTRLSNMASMVDRGGVPVHLALSSADGGHAVVAYKLEGGDYGRFRSRITIYDCNYPDEPQYFYFNEGTDQWEYKNYNKLVWATNDPEILDLTNYNIATENYEAYLQLKRGTAAYLVGDRLERYRIDGNTDEREDGIISYYDANAYLNEDGEEAYGGNLNCTLPDNGSEYQLSPADGDTVDYMLNYQNVAISAKAQDAQSVRFAPDGTLKVERATGDYAYAVCYNEGYHTLPWYKIMIEGTDSGDFTMEQTDKGIRMMSDHLDGAKITVKNRQEEQTLTVSTKESDILISYKVVGGKEIPVILADADGDGVFEEEDTEFTISLDANGGTVSPNTVKTTNGKLVNLPVPNREGYRFDGWYTADGTDKVTSATVFTQDCVLYAKWIPEEDEIIEPDPHISWNIAVRAGVGGTVNGGGVFEENATVTVEAVPDNGYRFVRWEEDGMTVSTNAEYTFTANKDRSLTAFFEKIDSVSGGSEDAVSGSLGGDIESDGMDSSPMTNDSSHIEFWTSLMLCSFVGIITVVIVRLRRRR